MRNYLFILYLLVLSTLISCKKQKKEKTDQNVDLKITVLDYYTNKPVEGIPVDLYFCKNEAFGMGPACEVLERSTTKATGEVVFLNRDATPGDLNFFASQYYSVQLEQTENYAATLQQKLGTDHMLSLQLYPLLTKKISVNYKFDPDRVIITSVSNLHLSTKVDSLKSKTFYLKFVPDNENYFSIHLYQENLLQKDTSFMIKPVQGDTSTIVLNL